MDSNLPIVLKGSRRQRRCSRENGKSKRIRSHEYLNTSDWQFKLNGTRIKHPLHDACKNENTDDQTNIFTDYEQTIEQKEILANSLEIQCEEVSRNHVQVMNLACHQLPVLLLIREIGFTNSVISNRFGFKQHWQRRVLLRQNRNSLHSVHQISTSITVDSELPWRPYCLRRIPFTELGTPICDAVLALDPSGSYMICVGGKRCLHTQNDGDDCKEDTRDVVSHDRFNSTGNNNEYFSPIDSIPLSSSVSFLYCKDTMQVSLALKFYGLPSPQRIEVSKCKQESPTLFTIPIAYKNKYDQNANNIDDEWDIRDLPSPPPALVPIRVWISTDNCIGVAVARLWSHELWRGCSNHVRVVVFPSMRALTVPREHNSTTNITHTLILDKFQVDRIGLQKPSHDANLLWIVNLIPIPEKKILANFEDSSYHETRLCQEAKDSPAYLFAIDIEDGYRLNWIYLECNHQDDNIWNTIEIKNERIILSESSNNSSCAWKHVRNLVVAIPNIDAGWQHCWSDRRTSARYELNRNDTDPQQLQELIRYQQLRIGFTAFLSVAAILFELLARYPKFSSRKPTNGATSSSLPTYTHEIVSVTDGGRVMEMLLVFSAPLNKKGCASATRCVGVFILIDLFTHEYCEVKWIQSYNQIFDENDLDQVCSLALARRKEQCPQVVDGNASPDISTEYDLKCLYPDCQTIDNIAVRQQRPVFSMKACDAPVELYYG